MVISLDGPNGGTMSDDAGLDDMVNLANRELMESYRNDYKKCRSKQSEALDQSLVPVHVKR